jgi:predicted transcriptional regulator
VALKIVLLSVKPEYADRILKGTKRFEFRRAAFASPVDEILLYATSPTKRIVGLFRIDSVHKGSPSSLWNRFARYAGIGRSKYFSYFAEAKRAFALQVHSTQRFLTHVDPRSVWPNFYPPQSFRYLEKEEAAVLKGLGMLPVTPTRSSKLSP